VLTPYAGINASENQLEVQKTGFFPSNWLEPALEVQSDPGRVAVNYMHQFWIAASINH